MVQVLFFASVREALGVDHLSLAWSPGMDLDGLQAILCESRGEPWPEVLGRDNIIRAVNQEVAAHNVPLVDGDEVAFYPPVTGG